jgi:hypothetical protein
VPRVKTRDEFATTQLVGGVPARLVVWKFVEPDYASDRQFVHSDDVAAQRGRPAAALYAAARSWALAHLHAHERGTCDCDATLDRVREEAPSDERTLLICEEVL